MILPLQGRRLLLSAFASHERLEVSGGASHGQRSALTNFTRPYLPARLEPAGWKTSNLACMRRSTLKASKGRSRSRKERRRGRALEHSLGTRAAPDRDHRFILSAGHGRGLASEQVAALPATAPGRARRGARGLDDREDPPRPHARRHGGHAHSIVRARSDRRGLSQPRRARRLPGASGHDETGRATGLDARQARLLLASRAGHLGVRAGWRTRFPHDLWVMAPVYERGTLYLGGHHSSTVLLDPARRPARGFAIGSTARPCTSSTARTANGS